jgi:hypothetical protein
MVLPERIPKNAETALKSMKRLMELKKKLCKPKKMSVLPKGKMLTSEAITSKIMSIMKPGLVMKVSAPKPIITLMGVSPLKIV